MSLLISPLLAVAGYPYLCGYAYVVRSFICVWYIPGFVSPSASTSTMSIPVPCLSAPPSLCLWLYLSRPLFCLYLLCTWVQSSVCVCVYCDCACIKDAALRLVSWSPINTTSSAKENAQHERIKLKVQGVLEQIADYLETDWVTTSWLMVDCGQSPTIMFGQGWIASEVLRWCLTKGRLQAKSRDDVWPQVDRKQSPAMMLD